MLNSKQMKAACPKKNKVPRVVSFSISLPATLLAKVDQVVASEHEGEIPNRSRYFRDLAKRDINTKRERAA